jgi:protein-S-isoprenylcysteine O-methyltransferase Ste14
VTPVELVFAVGWAAFWIYWLAAAFSMKRGRVDWSREGRIRLAIIAVAVVLARLGLLRGGHGVQTDPWLAGVGLVLFGFGLGLAVWARVHLGRNWGTPMTRKNEPELVTSGPYRLVRHPIYSGILAATIGTAVALSWRWLPVVALVGSTSSTARRSRSATSPNSSRTAIRRTSARRRCSCRSCSDFVTRAASVPYQDQGRSAFSSRRVRSSPSSQPAAPVVGRRRRRRALPRTSEAAVQFATGFGRKSFGCLLESRRPRFIAAPRPADNERVGPSANQGVSTWAADHGFWSSTTTGCCAS